MIDLPVELWVSILAMAEGHHVCRLARVSRRFAELSRDASLWKELCRVRFCGGDDRGERPCAEDHLAGGREHARAGVAWKCVAEALEAFRASEGDRPSALGSQAEPSNPSCLAWLLEACPPVKLLGAESKERLQETQEGALWRRFFFSHCVACTLVVGRHYTADPQPLPVAQDANARDEDMMARWNSWGRYFNLFLGLLRWRMNLHCLKSRKSVTNACSSDMLDCKCPGSSGQHVIFEQSPKRRKKLNGTDSASCSISCGRLSRCVFSPSFLGGWKIKVLAVDSSELNLLALELRRVLSFFLRVPATTFAVEFYAEVPSDGSTLLVEWPPADCSLAPRRELDEKLARITLPAAHESRKWRGLWEEFHAAAAACDSARCPSLARREMAGHLRN